jgi:hypothetical protein
LVDAIVERCLGEAPRGGTSRDRLGVEEQRAIVDDAESDVGIGAGDVLGNGRIKVGVGKEAAGRHIREGADFTGIARAANDTEVDRRGRVEGPLFDLASGRGIDRGRLGAGTRLLHSKEAFRINRNRADVDRIDRWRGRMVYTGICTVRDEIMRRCTWIARVGEGRRRHAKGCERCARKKSDPLLRRFHRCNPLFESAAADSVYALELSPSGKLRREHATQPCPQAETLP